MGWVNEINKNSKDTILESFSKKEKFLSTSTLHNPIKHSSKGFLSEA